MKELYSFDVERVIEKQVPHVKKTKDGPVETTKKVKKKIKNRIVFGKPSILDLEDAEFFYGQKYNEYINAGFLTKSMLSKKLGDMGGLTSKISQEAMEQIIVDNMEASRTIEFFDGGKNLSEEQTEQLQEAKKTFASTRVRLYEYESNLRSQFSQTADSKAEIKVIEWLVLNFSYFEDSINDKKDLFEIFEGDEFEQKRTFLRAKNIYNNSFEKLIRVASIWYNKMGNDQESIGKAMSELFDPEAEALDGQVG